MSRATKQYLLPPGASFCVHVPPRIECPQTSTHKTNRSQQQHDKPRRRQVESIFHSSLRPTAVCCITAQRHDTQECLLERGACSVKKKVGETKHLRKLLLASQTLRVLRLVELVTRQASVRRSTSARRCPPAVGILRTHSAQNISVLILLWYLRRL